MKCFDCMGTEMTQVAKILTREGPEYLCPKCKQQFIIYRGTLPGEVGEPLYAPIFSRSK